MNVTITPAQAISGEVKAPPSKAQTHRALFAGLLSKGTTRVHHPLICDDTKATANAVSSLGAKVDHGVDYWSVESVGSPRKPKGSVECGESGVTLRFTVPISALTGSEVRLSGSESLIRRPLRPLIEAMSQLGISVNVDSGGVTVGAAPVDGGRVQISGDVSSQFISGLLFAGALMKNGLEIQLTSPLESRGYVSLTTETMKQHGVTVQVDRDMSLFRIAPQAYRATDHEIPGDYSSAAFLISAGIITDSRIFITGLPHDNADPDSAFLSILASMGATPKFSTEGLLVEGGKLHGAKVNISDCPDLGPAVAVIGNYAQGQTEISGARRLRYKESNRLEAIRIELQRLGAQVQETADGLIIVGPNHLRSGTVESHSDHRVVMALAVAALGASDSITIQDAECVNKSYPNFFNDLRSLGVSVD